MKNLLSKVVLFVVFVLACFQGAVYGQTEVELQQKSVLAKASDVIGVWEMYYQVVRPSVKNESLFFSDYQFFKFFEDGYVVNIASTKKLDTKDVNMYINTMPKKTTYRFIADGLLEINRSQRDFDSIMISIITADMTAFLREGAPLLKKGDLILSYLDPDKKLYMQRYLRKWGE